MGVKYLNKFLTINCKKAIKNIEIKELRNKTIVIDTSIYLYKFKKDNSLLESMYMMIYILKNFNITPIFIFDGKPPEEKYDILKERKNIKENAKSKFDTLKDKLKDEKDMNNIFMILKQLHNEKKKIIKIRNDEIKNIKDLFDKLKIQYIIANGEADELCARLVINNIAYACLSEDMDLFLYKCPRVIRDFNLYSRTAIIYSFEKIINTLNCNSNEFKEICVISGTDYNSKNNNINLFKVFELFKLYKNNSKNIKDFYLWLFENKYITDYSNFKNISNMFNIQNTKFKIFNKIENNKIENNKIENNKKLLFYNFDFNNHNIIFI